MKLIISAVALSGLFTLAACNDSAMKEKDSAIEAQQHKIDSMNAELARKHVIDSMNEVTRSQYTILPQQVAPIAPAVAEQPAKVVTTNKTRKHRATSPTRRQSSSSNTTTTVAQAPVAQEPVAVAQEPVEQPRKKGWSAKAKGAVIGAGTGAAAGAIINGRNRGAGAIIGGVLGAAAGTGTGAVIDKKKGR